MANFVAQANGRRGSVRRTPVRKNPGEQNLLCYSGGTWAPPLCAQSARDRALGALKHVLRIIGELGEELFDLLVSGGIDVEIGPLGFGQEFRIPHGVLERPTQDRQA